MNALLVERHDNFSVRKRFVFLAQAVHVGDVPLAPANAQCALRTGWPGRWAALEYSWTASESLKRIIIIVITSS